MKYFALFLFTFTTSFLAHSQEITSHNTIINNGVRLNKVFLSEDKKHGWICGAMGEILISNDSGKSWQEITQNATGNSLREIYFRPTNDTGWAVGRLGVIIKSTDGGLHWAKINNSFNIKADLNSISFTKDGKHGIIVGNYGVVIYSDNYGKTWKIPNLFWSLNKFGFSGAKYDELHNQCYFFGSETAIQLTRLNLFDKSSDFKSLTNDCNTPITVQGDSISSIFFNPISSQIIAGCQDGRLIRSPDNGATWFLDSIATDANINDICFLSNTLNGYLITSDGKLFRTKDGGSKWILDRSFDVGELASIAFSEDGKIGICCGLNGFIANTVDGGITWTSTRCIDFDISGFYIQEDNNLAWISGSNGALANIKNGYTEWTRVSDSNFTTDLFYLSYLKNSNRILAVGDSQTIVSYSIGSRKWKVVHFSHNQNKNKWLIRIASTEDESFICAVGTYSTLMFSIDGGSTWSTKILDNDSLPLRGLFLSNEGRFCFIAGAKGTLYFSSDKFSTYKKITFLDSTENLGNIVFTANNSIGYVCTSSSIIDHHLYKTLDCGKSWHKENTLPLNSGMECVAFAKNDSELFATSITGQIYHTIDQGKNWFQIKPDRSYQRLTGINFDSKNQLIIVGYEGTLIRPKKNIDTVSFNLKLRNGNFFPVIKIHGSIDAENVQIHVTVNGLIDHADKQYIDYATTYDKIDSIQGWPTSLFKENSTISFEIEMCDGFNIIKRDTSFFYGTPLWGRITKYMFWFPLPNNATDLGKFIGRNTSLFVILYIITILLLFIFAPFKFVQWHEAMCNSKVPVPKKLPKYLVLFLIENKRSLDAFITYYSEEAMKKFTEIKDVSIRPHWVPAPFKLSHREIVSFISKEPGYTPGLNEIREYLKSQRLIISIEGQGGAGKSSLAFQLAKWGCESNKQHWIGNRRMLPLFINKLDNDLDIVCKNKLEYVTDRAKISDVLVSALLRTKRLLAVIDGISEMPTNSLNFVDPVNGSKDTHAVILTSRKSTDLPEALRIVPSGLTVDYLDNLIDGFTIEFAGANKFKEQREVLRAKIIDIINLLNASDPDKPIPLVILRLMIEQASTLMDLTQNLSTLPNNLPELFEAYIKELFKNESIDNQATFIKKIRKLSMIMVGLTEYVQPIKERKGTNHNWLNKLQYKPQWVPMDICTQFVEQKYINAFKINGLLIVTGDDDDVDIKFATDSIAEYFAAREICSQFRTGAIINGQMKELLAQCIKNNASLSSYIFIVAHNRGIVIPT